MANVRLSSLIRLFPLIGLGIITGFAARQNYRVRRLAAQVVAPEEQALPSTAPLVSIILPVRNEETNIDGILTSLLAQDYPHFEILVIDDNSSDKTPLLLERWRARDSRMRVHHIDALPEGWAGKANALHSGVRLTTSPWLLFTDADTRHAPQTLRLMMGHALHEHDDFLSMLTDMKLTGLGMHLLTPTGFIILTEVAIPSEMRDPGHAGAIAVGQYILLRREAYEKTQGYANPRMRATFADDVELAQLFKQYKQRTDIVSGQGLVFNEQWTTWRSVWQGWRKSLYSEIAPNPLIGVGASMALLTFGLTPLLALFSAFFGGQTQKQAMWKRSLIGLLGGLALALQIDSFRHINHLYKSSRSWAFAAPICWTTFGLVMLDTTRLALTGRGAGWKGRSVPDPRNYRRKARI